MKQNIMLRTKQPSKKLQELVITFVGKIKDAKAAFDELLEQGRIEGFSDLEIGDMIRDKAKGKLSNRQIRRLLPDTAKHTEKMRTKQQICGHLSANEHKSSDSPPIPEEIKQMKEDTSRRIDWDNYNIRTTDAMLDSYTNEELRINLHNALWVVSSVKQDLKWTTESFDDFTKRYRDLKKKYKVCIACDNKGVDYKTFGNWHCAKDLKRMIRVNEEMAPMANKMFVAAANLPD